MPVRGGTLGHIVLNVRSLRVSEQFYRSILGMKVSARNRRTKMTFLSFGREHHDVALVELAPGEKYRSGKGVEKLHHFCIYAQTSAEVDALAAALKRRNIPVVSGPEILEIARNRSVSFLDPDGNRVEVACNANKFGFKPPKHS
ncbi:MAG TPA: VOC family protein [Terriglobales bacterium]|nr:VOC family protein [Terriglobales bacterium]